MASIEMNLVDHKKVGVKRVKKLSTKVDMTPMVDLGFLLITFFIFTTTMSSPTSMKLIVPKNDSDRIDVKESGALTILIGNNEIVYYYEGKLEKGGENFIKSNLKDIRKVIINKKREATAKGKKNGYSADNLDKDFMVIIKPNKDATYKSIVDVLDEMSINSVRRYAMVDATEEERKLMKFR